MTYPPQPEPGRPGPPPRQYPDQPSGQGSYPPDPGPGWQPSAPPYSADQTPPGGIPVSGAGVSGPPVSGAGVSGPPVSGAGASGPPAGAVGGMPGAGYPPPPAGPPPRRSPLPFLLGGVAVLAVAVLVVGLVVVFGDDSSDKPTPPQAHGSSSAPSSASPHASSGGGDQRGRVVEQSTGWSFVKAGSPWLDRVRPRITEIRNGVGQSVALGDHMYASIELGKLSSEFDYDSPDDLKSVKDAVTTSMLGHYYGPDGASPDSDSKHVDEHITQYGRQAWLWEFWVSYESTGGDETRELVVMAVLDTGRGSAAMFYGSVPEGHDDLRKQMVDVAGTLKQQS